MQVMVQFKGLYGVHGAMKCHRGPIYEVMSKHCNFVWVFEVELCQRMDVPFLACSKDGIALLGVGFFQSDSFDEDNNFTMGGNVVAPASVGTKIRVQPRILGLSINQVSLKIIFCVMVDGVFQKYIAHEHIGQNH